MVGGPQGHRQKPVEPRLIPVHLGEGQDFAGQLGRTALGIDMAQADGLRHVGTGVRRVEIDAPFV